MEKSVATLGKGAASTAWNFAGDRLAAGSVDGVLSIFDSSGPASSSFSCTSSTKVHEASILKIIWVPPEFGDAVACICEDGSFSLWEELADDTLHAQWKLAQRFKGTSIKVLDLQFRVSASSLKMAAAFSNGYVKIYEVTNPLELKDWQLKAEFQNVLDSVSLSGKVSCKSASLCWNPSTGQAEGSCFIMGFRSDSPQLNSAKVWEFDQLHQRWLPVAELALPEDKGDPVLGVAWAPNIGRPYELIAVATQRGIAIWHLGLTAELDGRLSTERVALLSAHEGEVWQLEWDMSGMTLASSGSDGAVKLWQANLNGIWKGQATFLPTS
ncbi:hypothetical protein MLD38_016645 [Melastoma candidum]|uniref:Uncharacterized protein n=1 Tax=Melastoma candidum TaxID=119954 RepID=A0ACB9QP96_9MYRT|nr:hypothetical protein MLD38_016645 [Melastoma candidum]